MVELSVADVRSALARVSTAGAVGPGEAATLLLGKIFHEVFAELVGADPLRSGLRVLVEAADDEAERIERLAHHTWTRLLAPRLVRHRAALRYSTGQLLVLWRATQNLMRWLNGVVRELLIQDDRACGNWERLSAVFQAEVPLACELREPGWAEPVRLVGFADSILHIPNRHGWCAIELKLGRAQPSVDLGQVALYHLIFSRTQTGSVHTALVLMRFSPELEESLIEADAVVEAQKRLLGLIGSLAGVVRIAAPPSNTQPTAHEELGQRVVRAYREFGVGVELRGVPSVGPRFLRFEVRPTAGGKIDSIRKLAPEVQLRLSLTRPPIILQEGGQLFLDLPRTDPQIVLFSSILQQLPELDRLRGSAKLPIGVDPGGRLHFADLGSSGRSHVLVAGTTGSGKSEWLRMIVAGLFASNTPETLRIVTIDPKLNAFTDLERSPFLWTPDAWWIPNQGRQAVDIFEELVEEMERRYQLTHNAGADHLGEYVEKSGKPFPRILCVCDEYLALVSQTPEKKRIEAAVGVLGAKARASGIHLVLATQNPTRKVIQGVIDSNLSCRVALTLPGQIESRMILGINGAEKLTGSGDLLYKDFGDPVRLQSPYLPPEERKRWLRQTLPSIPA